MKKQITVAVRGSSFGNQYMRNGVRELYSLWKVTLKVASNGISILDHKVENVNYNMDREEIPQKHFDNDEKLEKMLNSGIFKK